MKSVMWVFLCLGLFASVLGPERAVAQAGQIWIEPRLGWVMPMQDLGRTDILGGAGYGVFGQLDPGLSFGLGVGVGIAERWALRVYSDRTRDQAVPGEWRCAPFVVCPAVLLRLDAEMDRSAVGLDVLYRPDLGLPVRTTLSSGVAVRKNTLTWSSPDADVALPTLRFEDQQALYRFGIGLDHSLGAATLFSEVEALFSHFGGRAYQSIEGSVIEDRPTTVDVGLVGGLRVRVR